MKNSVFISHSPWDVVRFIALVLVIEIISCSAMFVDTVADSVRTTAKEYVSSGLAKGEVVTSQVITPFADGVRLFEDTMRSDGNMLIKVVTRCKEGEKRVVHRNILLYDFKTGKIIKDVSDLV